jgi:hypothetical protein
MDRTSVKRLSIASVVNRRGIVQEMFHPFDRCRTETGAREETRARDHKITTAREVTQVWVKWRTPVRPSSQAAIGPPSRS